MSKSAIEWTEDTWNPIVGCSILSPGCTNCYAMKMAARIEAMNANALPGHGSAPQYAGTTRKVNGHAVWTGKLALAGDNILLQPLKRKKPTAYFVNSMGDLFHEDVSDEWIDKVFAVMALSRQHTFQVLTKRAKRMREYCLNARIRAPGFVERACGVAQNIPGLDTSSMRYLDIVSKVGSVYPLPNVWLGVSTERQQEADERIPLLLQTPAAIRFISAEPLLDAIDLTRIRAPRDPHAPDEEWLFDAPAIGDYCEQRFTNSFGEVWFDSGDGPYRETKLDWVIVGGESGADARPMHPDWARSLKVQCEAAGVPFFFKQWGEWRPAAEEEIPARFADPACDQFRCMSSCGFVGDLSIGSAFQHKPARYPDCFPQGPEGDATCSAEFIRRVGKKAAGRALDGIEYNAIPVTR